MRHSEKHEFLGQKRCFYALHADLQKDDRQGVTRKPVPFFTPPFPKPHPRLSGRYLKEAFMVNLKNGFGLITPLFTLKSEIRFQ